MRGLLKDAGFRAFLLVWSGQVVSLLGSGLTAFALGVWIYQQTASTTQYALVTFCAAFPPLVILPLSGPLIDRRDRKRLLIACEIAGTAGAAAVAILAGLGVLSLAWACAIAAITSSANAVQGSAQAATVTLLVRREQLGRANGLGHLALAFSQIAAPPLAGMLLPIVGLLGIAAIDAVTFAVAIVTIAAASIPRQPATATPRHMVAVTQRHAGDVTEREVAATMPGQPASTLPHPSSAAIEATEMPHHDVVEQEPRSYGHDLRYGWRYIFARPGLAALLVMFALTNFFSELSAVLFTPLVLTFATPADLGSILAAGGIGMVAGSAALSLWGGPRRAALGATLFAAASGLTVAAAGFTVAVPLLAAVVFVFFSFQPLMMGSSQVLWQRTVPAVAQGRVFTARAAVAMAAIPLASLVAGPLADRLLEPAMAAGGGLAPALGSFLGVGKGRGIALAIVGSGIAAVLVAAAAASYGPLRRLDEPEIAAASAPAPVEG